MRNGYVDGLPHGDDLFGNVDRPISDALQISYQFLKEVAITLRSFAIGLLKCKKLYALRFDLSIESIYSIIIGD